MAKFERLHDQYDTRLLALRTIDCALAIQRIAAPTFEEAERAAFVQVALADIGLTDIMTDEVANVYGRLPGRASDGPGVILMAHTDTVFDADTDLTARREGSHIYGPGLGDNSIGVAALVQLALHLSRGEPLACDVWFVATSREEGLGDLGGVRGAYARLSPKVEAIINLEGLAFGHIYNAGIAVRRLKIAVTTEGGHSWLHFGQPSAIHHLIHIAERITALQPPKSPRTTFNIGVIEGGQSINSIASEASLLLDLRSESSEALSTFEKEVRAIADLYRTSDATIAVEVIGDRPAGSIPNDHPLVQLALSSLAKVGVQGLLERGSTDGNIPLAHGCPTVTVGVTRGGNAHRLDEYIETQPIADGLKQILILLRATTDRVAVGTLR